MDLHVDDFGCVPDGRVLEQVSTDAGSAVLAVLDGALRPSDLTKHIAIPGAVDLVATIAALLDRQTVENAVMAQGNTRLTGTLVAPTPPHNPRPFRSDLHVGLRITVAGAGPGGSTLVSDVLEVIDPTTIRLAVAAATAVVNAEVILNRPDRVALSNYARRDVQALTVDLGDRSIDDAAMRIGARGLVSEAAKFSSRDLGKEVTIRNAGLFVTTIVSFDTSTQVTLAAAAQRAVAGAQADVWRTDSRPGFELLLGALTSLEVESAEVLFGAGVYDFTRIPDLADPMNAAIGLRGRRNLTLRGSGAGATVLRLMPNQDLSGPDTHVIETRDCHCLTLRDFTVHGAYLTMGNTNEQMHGINLNEGSEEIAIERVRVFQSAGDGIRLLGRPKNEEQGTPAKKVRKIWIDGCRLVQNKRTGVGFQRAVELVWVRNCYIEMTPPSTDSCVDFEPSGNTAPADVVIDSNLMVHGTRTLAVSISGIRGPDPTRRVKFINNIVLGGSIFCTDVDQLTVCGNLVLVPDDPAASSRIPLHVQRGGDSLLITDNLLVTEDGSTDGVISVSEVNQRRVSRAIIGHNLCFARSGGGIRVLSSHDVAVEGNMVVATGSCTQGILVHSQPSDVDNVSIRNNDITVRDPGSWATGIHVIAREPVRQLSVLGNAIRGAGEGVRFQGPGFQQTPVCALNHVGPDVASPLVGLTELPERALVAGGATGHGGASPGSGTGRSLVGSGDPNGNVVGNVGDIYQRVDAAPGARLFVKESDEQPNGGWAAK